MSLCSDYLFRDFVRGIPRSRVPADGELATARSALERAEGLVGAGPFLVGESLTLADLYLAPQVSNCREKAPELLDGLVALAGWAERIAPRDSFRRTWYGWRKPERIWDMNQPTAPSSGSSTRTG